MNVAFRVSWEIFVKRNSRNFRKNAERLFFKNVHKCWCFFISFSTSFLRSLFCSGEPGGYVAGVYVALQYLPICTKNTKIAVKLFTWNVFNICLRWGKCIRPAVEQFISKQTNYYVGNVLSLWPKNMALD